MNESSPQTRPGSGRRRPNRHPAKASANKAYLSESDAPGRGAAEYAQPAGLQTPQKLASQSPTPKNRNGSGQPARNRPPRNVAASPEAAQQDRQTPPLKASAIKPASSMAYAGATFHASPAPSALPMPSFMAKLNPQSPPQPKSNAQPAFDQYTSANELEQPTPQRAVPFGVNESPLEAIFRADRAEKERARRTSSAHSMSAILGPHSPPSHPSPDLNRLFGSNPRNVPRSASQRSPGIPEAELNGNQGQPFGPAFSTPYHDRIRASKAGISVVNPTRELTQTSTNEDRSEALKRFLWGNNSNPTGQALQSTQSPPSASAARPPEADPSDKKTEAPRSADLAAMEDDLRRILKISS